MFLSSFLTEYKGHWQGESEKSWFMDVGQLCSIAFIILAFWVLLRALRKRHVPVTGPVYATTPKISKAIDEQTAKKTAERSAAAKEAAKANIKSASETKQEQPANNEPGNQQKK